MKAESWATDDERLFKTFKARYSMGKGTGKISLRF